MKVLITTFLILFIFNFCAVGFKHGKAITPVTKAVFFNSPLEYGIGINKQIFWSEKTYHDSILIIGNRLNVLLDEKFYKLKDTVLWKGIDDLKYAVAFIRPTNAVNADTFYASPTLRYWIKGNKTYVDTSGYFTTTFKKFLIYDNK